VLRLAASAPASQYEVVEPIDRITATRDHHERPGISALDPVETSGDGGAQGKGKSRGVKVKRGKGRPKKKA
jgi:hypothetical protein